MQFTVNSQDLADALSIVTRAISARPAKQILEGVLIEADPDGINLVCSDGNLSIECAITGDVKEGGRIVLPGRLFNELVRKLPSGNVKVDIPDSRAAVIRCESSRFTLSGMNAAEYPEIAPLNDESVTIGLPQNRFAQMISHVVFSAAVDETRQILTGCLLEVTPTEARLVALDGYRLAMQKLDSVFVLPEKQSMLRAVIPGRVMIEMSRILADEETECVMTFDGARMQACFGNTKLSTVLLAGEYIDYRRIIPQAFKTTARTKKSELSNAIDFAGLMAREGKNNLIRLSFSSDEVLISSNAETGNADQRVSAELSGEPIDIAFNAKYLSDVIRNVGEDELNMNFNSNVSPCVFKPTEGDDFVYLILPVRVFQ